MPVVEIESDVDPRLAGHRQEVAATATEMAFRLGITIYRAERSGRMFSPTWAWCATYADVLGHDYDQLARLRDDSALCEAVTVTYELAVRQHERGAALKFVAELLVSAGYTMRTAALALVQP